MTFLRLVNKIIALNSIFKFYKRGKKLSKREKFYVAVNKLDNRIKAIKYTTSINTINKYFDDMTKDVHGCIKLRPYFRHIYIADYKIDKIKDLSVIEQIKQEYIKAFVNENIEVNIMKSDLVNNFYIKNKYIKEAIFVTLDGIKHLPNDKDLKYKLTELENKLDELYITEKEK